MCVWIWNTLISSRPQQSEHPSFTVFLCFLCGYFTYLACILDESPCLFLDAWHVWVWGVNQSGDLCGSNKAVLCHWPPQIQTWGSHIRLHRPVGVRGTLNIITALMVCQLWEVGALMGCLDCGLDIFNFWLRQEIDHIWGLEKLIVSLV